MAMKTKLIIKVTILPDETPDLYRHMAEHIPSSLIARRRAVLDLLQAGMYAQQGVLPAPQRDSTFSAPAPTLPAGQLRVMHVEEEVPPLELAAINDNTSQVDMEDLFACMANTPSSRKA